MKTICLLTFFALLIACGRNNRNGLILENGEKSFRLSQRSKIEIRGHNRNLRVNIDDITNGTTLLVISDENSTLTQEFVSLNEDVQFLFDGEAYVITCTRMHNRLIGNDDASFTIRKRGAKPTADLTTEKQKIEALIKTVAASDVRFIRNGEEYGPVEAAEHLHSKWQRAEEEVITLDDFIEHIASRSSASGQPYQIKLKNGKIVPAKTWMQEQAKSL